MPISEAEWDRLNLIVVGHILELAGTKNADGSLPTVAQAIADIAALSKKVDALEAGTGGGPLKVTLNGTLLGTATPE